MSYLGHGQGVRVWIPLLVDELHIKVLGQVGGSHLEVHLSKGLAKTDALTSQERHEGKVAALLTARCQEKRTLVIEAFRKKLVWSLPLPGVAMHTMDVDLDDVACPNLILTDTGIL